MTSPTLDRKPNTSLSISTSKSSKASITPRLPPEILSHIFWYATDPGPPLQHEIEPNSPNPYDLVPCPSLSDRLTYFHLRAVCSLWRGVAQSSPHIRLSLAVNKEREIPPDFPWDRVGSLQIRGVSPTFACRILSLCHHLLELHMDYRVYDGPSNISQHGRHIVLDSVQSLSCISPRSASKSGFFTRFHFPAVRKLKWDDGPLPSNIAEIRDFFQRMRQLEELHFYPSLDHYLFIKHADLFENITTLVTGVMEGGDGGGGSAFLQPLTIKPNPAKNMLPRLRTLILIIGEDIDPDGLIVVFWSRRNSPVDWSDPSQRPSRLALPSYDSHSPHWQAHTRLTKFSVVPEDEDEITLDWTFGEHYPVLEPMFKEAKRVCEFAMMWSESMMEF